MSESLKDQSPSSENSAEEIAAWISSEAKTLDARAQASNIIEVDLEDNPGALTQTYLEDGLHRVKDFASHSIFITKDGEKTHEIRFHDSMPPMSREHDSASEPEIGLLRFHGGVDLSTELNGNSMITSSLRIIVTNNKIISADRVHSFRDPQEVNTIHMELSPEYTITGSAEILEAVEDAIVEHEETTLSQS